jgi:hypothetical protein
LPHKLGRWLTFWISICECFLYYAINASFLAAATDESRMAYIDSKMADLRHGALPAESTNDANGVADDAAIAIGKSPRARQPAGVGKIQEVDLGPDAMLRNIARTEEAARRLQRGESSDAPEQDGTKPRLGPDGKPWRRRRRRNSDDIKRDKLVEEVLRESRREDPPSLGK